MFYFREEKDETIVVSYYIFVGFFSVLGLFAFVGMFLLVHLIMRHRKEVIRFRDAKLMPKLAEGVGKRQALEEDLGRRNAEDQFREIQEETSPTEASMGSETEERVAIALEELKKQEEERDRQERADMLQ